MKLKIMLINPPRVDSYPVVREERFEHKDIGAVYPPLSLLYMAALLEKHPEYEIKVLDANGLDLSINEVRNEIMKFMPDLAVSRCGFDTQEQDLKVMDLAKAAGTVTVLRNKIISETAFIRDAILKKRNVDVFINSEPDSVIEQLAAAVFNNKEALKKKIQPQACVRDPDGYMKEDWAFLKTVPGISYYFNSEVITTEPAKEIENLDRLPNPAYHLLPDLKPYHTGVMKPPFALIATTRGCPFQCTFCAYGKSKCRERGIQSVISEIKLLKEKFGIKSFLFFDDTISIKEGRMEELAGRMIEEGLSGLEWACCTRANLVSYEMLKIMKRAGMKEIAIGIETGSETMLKNIKKGVTLDDIRQAARWCKELKVMFYGLAIIGLPGETRETVKETVKFIKEIDPFYTQFCFSVPFPNTEIYGYYEKNNYILTKDWEKYFPLSEEPVVRTEALTADDLKKLRRWAYMQVLIRPFYLLKKIRPFDWKWNIEGFMKVAGRIWRAITGKAVR
jgi:anaerobic magnesium-protoporphyrin IX monomethyl ester cyclase